MRSQEHLNLLGKKGRAFPKKRLRYPVEASEKMVVLVKARVPSCWSKRIQEEADLKTMGNVSEFLRFAIYQQIK